MADPQHRVAADELDLLIGRAATMVWAIWFARSPGRRPQMQYKKSGEIIAAPDDTLECQAILRDLFKQATARLSADEFRRRVIERAMYITWSHGDDDEGIEIMAEWHEMEAVLLQALNEPTSPPR